MAVSAVAGLASIAGSASVAYSVGGAVWAAWGLSSAATAFALGAGLSAVNRALMPKPSLGVGMEGLQTTVRNATESRKLVYGQMRTGGTIVYMNTDGEDNKYLDIVIAFAPHQIDSYQKIYFNEEVVWDNGVYQDDWGSHASLYMFDGTQDAASRQLNEAYVTWTDNHKLLDIAYVHARLTWDADKYQNGIPNITAEIKGKHVFDPRTSTTAWSDNPALCLYDYMLDTKYGMGEPAASFDIASVIAAANLCDQDVDTSGAYMARYTLNGVVDTANKIKDNIEAMTSAMAGHIAFSGGKYFMYGGSFRTPLSTVFNESHLVGELQLTTKQSRRSIYNAVKGVFVSAEDDYIATDYPAQISSQYSIEDGEPIYLDMPLPFTTNHVRAQRLAKIALLRSRQQRVITMPMNMAALQFKAGDVIKVTNDKLGFNEKLFEVIGYDLAVGETLTVNVQAIETDAALFDWSTSDEQEFVFKGEIPTYDGTPVAPTSLQLNASTTLQADGVHTLYIDATWVASVDAFVDFYRFKYTVDNKTTSVDTRDTSHRIVATSGSEYAIEVTAINLLGRESTVLTDTVTPVIDTDAPDAPTSITATGGVKSIEVTWDNPAQSDFKHVEIYYTTDTNFTPTDWTPQNNGTASLAKVDGESFILGGLTAGDEYKFWLRSVDFTGNKSAYASRPEAVGTAIATPADDIDVSGIDLSQADNSSSGFVDATGAAAAAPVQSVAGLTGSVLVADIITEGALIVAGDNISDLTNDAGYTTFDAGDVEAAIANDVTVIDGAKITTGTVAAARLDVAGLINTQKLAINYELDLISSGVKAVTITDNNIYIGAPNNGSWDTDVYSSQSYKGKAIARASVQHATARSMFALNTDPTGNDSFASLDFAWYLNLGTLGIYESGSSRGTFGTYSVGDILEVRYAGTEVKYYHNGALKRTVTVASDLEFYFDSSFRDENSGLNDVYFGQGGVAITPDKIYQGSGNWNSADTGFYLDSDGKFSLDSHLSFDGSTLVIDGEVRANSLNVVDATVSGNLEAKSVTAGSIQVESISQAVWNEIDSRFIAVSGAAGGFYDKQEGLFNGTNLTLTTVAVDHESKDITLQLTATQHWASAVYKDGNDLKVNIIYEYSTNGTTWTQVTDGTNNASWTYTASRYEWNYGGYTSYTYYLNSSGTLFTIPAAQLAIGTYYFRARLVPVNASTNVFTLASPAISTTFEANEAAAGATATGGNADTVDNLHASSFMRSDANTSTTGDITIARGTTAKKAVHDLYIGGSGLDGEDSAIYIGNNGNGGGYGWEFYYQGSGTGNDNKLIIRSENLGTQVDALSFTQDGSATFGKDLTVSGNLTISGTTTTLNTATLDVEDKNITLNYGAGDTSASADGAGITIQDAVDASTDASITWDATNDEFDFSHPVTISHTIAGTTTSHRITPLDVLTLHAENTTQQEYDGFGQGLVFAGQTYNNSTVRPLGRILHQIADSYSDTTVGTELHFQTIDDSSEADAPTTKLSINKSGNIVATGTITASGYNNSNWDTAYTYSQVGHLPLAGGTIGGGNVANPLTISRAGATASNICIAFSEDHGTATTKYFGLGGDEFRIGDSADLGGSGKTVWHSGNLTNNSSNWNTAYTYSQVGHLPLSGGTVTGFINLSKNSRLYQYTENGAYINWDTRDATNGGFASARVHKWARKSDDSGYAAYYENWYDGNSYHEIGIDSDRFKFGGGIDASGSGQFAGALKVTETGTSQHILIGNQDSGGTNKPAMIRGVNGSLRFGFGNSWSGEGGTMTEVVALGDTYMTVNGDMTATGYLQATSYLYTRNDLRVLNAAGTGWTTWATRSNGNYNLSVGTIDASSITASSSSYVNGDNNRLRVGSSGGGKSLTIGNTMTSDGTNLDYAGYIAYDCYFDGTNWAADRTNLGRKWMTQVGGYHNNTWNINYYGGDASSGWASSAWSRLFTLDASGNGTFAGAINATNIDASGELEGAYIGVSNSTQNNGYGISLYGGGVAGEPTYGLMFQGTGAFGQHGSVTGSWATYFTMNNDDSRGWIFRKAGVSNAASISAGGNANFNGTLTTGGRANFGEEIRMTAGGNIRSNSTFAFLTTSGGAQYGKFHGVSASDSYSIGSYGGYMNAKNGFMVNNTTVISSSRNLTNIGTVDTSGNIKIVKSDGRFQMDNGTGSLLMGSWDGYTHRIEGGSDRPMLITSYSSGGVNIGYAGGTTLSVRNGATYGAGLFALGSSWQEIDLGTFNFENNDPNNFIDIIFACSNYWGMVEVEITSSYSYQNACGSLIKRFAVGHNSSYSGYGGGSEEVISDTGYLSDSIRIGSVTRSGSNFVIPVNKYTTTKNTFSVRVKLFSVGYSTGCTVSLGSKYSGTNLAREYKPFRNITGKASSTSFSGGIEIAGTNVIDSGRNLNNIQNIVYDGVIYASNSSYSSYRFQGRSFSWNSAMQAPSTHKPHIFQETWSGWDPILGVKTQNGFWQFGAYTSDVLYLGYMAGAFGSHSTNSFDKSITFQKEGSITASGDITAFSDVKLKDNISTISDALDKVMSLRGVVYTRKDMEDKEKLHLGVIAQEVEKVIPEVVHYNEASDVKSVSYGNITALLIEAIKEQQSEIDELKSLVKQLLEK